MLVSQIAPGQSIHHRPLPPAETAMLYRLRLQSDGTYRPIPLLPSENGHAPLAEVVKATGIDSQTLLQLWRSEFIQAVQPTPRKTLIHLDSLLKHIQATSDPDYWTRQRHDRYTAARKITPQAFDSDEDDENDNPQN